METARISEIENIIKARIEEETERSTAELTQETERLLKQGIERINNVYGSAVKTLEQLELTDATIFDFFQKTNGNIRVFEIENKWGGPLEVSNQNGRLDDRNPIRLKDNTNYKIILMAIEVGEKSG